MANVSEILASAIIAVGVPTAIILLLGLMDSVWGILSAMRNFRAKRAYLKPQTRYYL